MSSILSRSASVWRLCLVVMVMSLPAGPYAAGAPVDPLRLTHHPIEPLAEAVELVLDPAADGYSGRARIHIVAHAPASVIRLQAQDLELGAILLSPRVGEGSVVLASERGEIGLLTLTAPTAITPGDYTLEIPFRGKYRRDGVGIYKTEFQGDAYLFTQFESRFARLAFPCWDEPAFKLPWQITLNVSSQVSAFSNSAVAEETVADGRRTLVFARTPPMPSYLVALAVGPFETVAVPGLAVPGRIITPRGQSSLAGQIVAESPTILAALENYFGIPYPFGKLDQMAVPEFNWGGMENAGLITYNDEAILRTPDDKDLSSRRKLVQIVAHEMAHHWFGDLVTMEWWNDLWLNESFASWMELKVLEAVYPELNYSLGSFRGKQWAMRLDSLPSTGPVRREILASEDPEQFVDALSYEKGEAVLTMVESWVGPEAFRAAMKLYFKRHRWGSARAEDLWSAFSAASGSDMSAVVTSFIQQPGVPQVSIEVLPGDRVRLRQKRFAALGGELSPDAMKTTWRVPLVFKYATASGERTARVLLTAREQTVDIAGISAATWIHPNAGEAGYYRWQLEPARERTLIHKGSAALSPLERLGLLGNATAMRAAGELEPGLYLSLLLDYLRDPVTEVAQRAADSLMQVRRTYLDDEDAAAFAVFCRATLRPVLDRIGMRAVAGEAGEIAALRRELIGALGVDGADVEVIAMARKLARQYVADPRSVDSGIAHTALDVAAWHGDAAFFDACEAAAFAASVPTDRSVLLGALGEFADPALCDRALALSFSKEVRSHERLSIARAMAGNSNAHRQRVVAWMMANFDAIRSSTSADSVSGLIFLASDGDAELFARTRAFLSAPERTSDLAEKSISEASDLEAQRQALRTSGQAEVRRFIAEYAAGQATAVRP